MSKWDRTCEWAETCGLCGMPVWGSGLRDATVMLIGEAPGMWEDRDGKPFVGKSGKELDNYLSRFAHISRAACYITNVVKCRPDSKDRDPSESEITICTAAYLAGEIAEVNPRVIVAVGKIAAQWVFGSHVKMEMVHGIGYRWEGRVVVPVYHPSYGLHSTRKMRFIQEDFAMVGEIVRGRGDVREWVKFAPQSTISSPDEGEDYTGEIEEDYGISYMG